MDTVSGSHNQTRLMQQDELCTEKPKCTAFGYRITPVDSDTVALEAICTLFFVEQESYLESLGGSSQEQDQLIRLIDRYLRFVQQKSYLESLGTSSHEQEQLTELIDRDVPADRSDPGRFFKVSDAELAMIRNFDPSKVPADDRTFVAHTPEIGPVNREIAGGSENMTHQPDESNSTPQNQELNGNPGAHTQEARYAREKSTDDSADQREQCHQVTVSCSEETSGEIPKTIEESVAAMQASVEVLRLQDRFENLAVEQQVERLTQLNGLSPAALLDQCSVKQRAVLSLASGIPDDCWPAINIRLVEEAIKKHTHDKPEGMFRIPVTNSQLDQVLCQFETGRISDAVLDSPKMSANVISRLIRTSEFFTQKNFEQMYNKLYSSFSKEVERGKIRLIQQQVLAQMDNRKVDLYRVCMRIMKYVYSEAPRKGASVDNAPPDGPRANRITRSDLSKMFAASLFQAITLKPCAPSAPDHAQNAESIKNTISEASFRKQAILHRLLELH